MSSNGIWSEKLLSEILEINPKTELKKGTKAKKIGMEYLTEFNKKIQGYEVTEFKSGSKFKNGDTLLARITPCLENGKTAFVDILDEEEVAFGSTEFFVIRAIEGKGDPQFIYYLAISNQLRNVAIQSMTGTSGRQRAQKEAILNLRILLPNLEEQRKIAVFLERFDKKIEINKKIISNLEELSQTLFKQWFISFDFPNQNGLPYKSSGGKMINSELGDIPEDWRVSKIGAESKIIRGASPRPIQNFMAEEGRPWVKITDANASISCFITKTKEFIIDAGIAKSRTVTPGTLILSNSATPGIPRFMDIVASVHDGWLIFSDYESVSKEYMYLYLLHERESILSFSNGSVFRNLKTDILKKYKLIVPTEHVLLEFQKIVEPLFQHIKSLTTEINILSSIRDNVLPRLLCGEINIPDESVVE